MNWNQFTAYIKLAIWIQMDEHLHYKCNMFKRDFEQLHMWINLCLFWTPKCFKTVAQNKFKQGLKQPRM